MVMMFVVVVIAVVIVVVIVVVRLAIRRRARRRFRDVLLVRRTYDIWIDYWPKARKVYAGI